MFRGQTHMPTDSTPIPSSRWSHIFFQSSILITILTTIPSMDPQTTWACCGIAAGVGVLSHLLYFIRGEHHKHTLQFVQILFVVVPCCILIFTRLLHVAFGQATLLAMGVGAFYLAGLWTSMIMYRAFFHRLNRFAGPWHLKLSKFASFITLRKLDNFRKSYNWHQTYGNFVRTGPNELSIIAPSAPSVVLGPRSQCHRSPWYEYAIYQDLESLHSTRDLEIHEARRRIWDRGFSAKALRDYESRVTDYTYELMGKISSFSGNSMNASAWFNYYSFDVMGDFAFGKSFNMLKTGKMHFAIDWLESSMFLLGLFSPIAWAIPVGAIAPIVGRDFRRFIAWCSEQAELRRDTKTEVPDIASWLLKAAEDRNDTEATKWLHGDSRLIIVAGSDTIAIALTHIFYYLAKDPSHVQRLREELEPLMRTDEPFNYRDVQNTKHMNGIINEVLRMHPPVPSGVFRTTPPQGITIDGTFVPGDVNISVPFYAIGRSEECFHRPNDFIPERWYSQPELIKERSAFAPFSLGPYGCIGQKLAQMEMKTVVPLLVTKFDISLAPGEDGSELLEKSRDAFTLRMGELNVVFEERKSG